MALDAWTGLPCVWAQATATGPGPGSGAPDASLRLAILAFRRWCASLTLSPPGTTAGLAWPGLWAWLAGLAALLAVAALFQGPGRALAQAFDVAGNARLLAAALDRARRSGRLLAVVVGMTVVTWTASQTVSFNKAQGRDDALLVTRGRSLGEVALGQGTLAALTPLRDLAALASMIPLLMMASVVLFRYATDRWGTAIRPPRAIRARVARWATIGWTVTALYALYRSIGLAAGTGGLPMGGFGGVELVVVPTLLALAQGTILAWALAELRDEGRGGVDGQGFDVAAIVALIPAAALAGVLAFPASFAATVVALLGFYAPPGTAAGTALAPAFRWLLGRGLADLQAGALVFSGLLGAVAWSRGTPGDALRGYARLLAAEGGRLVAAMAAGGLAAGVGSAAAYFLVLALPASTWVLAAADGYAHYATLPAGLVLLAALVELGERSLPPAGLAGADAKTPGP